MYVVNPSVLYLTSNWFGAELLACLKKDIDVKFNLYPVVAETENCRYDEGFKLDVVLIVVELNTLAVALQVIVFLVTAVPVAFVAIEGTFPFVGQAEAPVNVFK